jgi:anti-sigma factor RsiW
MCEFRGKLTAWLDGELTSDEAADVEGHVQLCTECRGRAEAYRQASAAFEVYCNVYSERVLAPQHRRKLSRRTITISCAALAAAVAALLLIAPRMRIAMSPAAVPAPMANSGIVSQPIQSAQAPQLAPGAVQTESHLKPTKEKQIRRSALRPQAQSSDWLASEPAVEIAIPADAIFPPGALPDDVSFAADVTIAPDGSAQQIRLRPQFVEFERRSTRP